MKNSFVLLSGLTLAAALGLGACSRDVNSEMRASSPAASEFNRQVSESTKTDEELAADSSAAARRTRRRPAEAEAH